MKVAILGDGLLGRTLLDVFAAREDAVMLGHADVDVTSMDSLVAAFRAHRPDVVINTVAQHRLAECEKNPNAAWDVNTKGPERIGSLGVPQVYISTDYVFSDGGPHDEALPGQRPLSEYGRSKLAGELATLEHDGIVVRVSALYGHHPSHKGPTFPETVLRGWDPMRLPSDQRFSPTYAPDAAERIVRLALGMLKNPDGSDPCGQGPECGCNPSQGIYHAANAGSATWAEFGQEITEVGRHKRHIAPFAAKDPLRPHNSALRSARLPALRHWRLALAAWGLRYDSDLRANAVSPLRGA